MACRWAARLSVRPYLGRWASGHPHNTAPGIDPKRAQRRSLPPETHLAVEDPALPDVASRELGIVERLQDPSDGRAKLICLTDAGWDAMRTARQVIAQIEAEYAELVGSERFESAAQTLDELLRGLDSPQRFREGD